METTTQIKTFKNPITELDENEIFVFGSNTQGSHVGGAAFIAQSLFGAEWGKGEGLSGRSYAIPTVGSKWERLTIRRINTFVRNFAKVVKSNPDKLFLVTDIGTGIAGHSYESIAGLFKKHLICFDNIEFSEIMKDHILKL